MESSIGRFKSYLSDWVEKASRTVGTNHHLVKYVQLLKTDVISLLVSQIVIDNIACSQSVQTTALLIANTLEEEAKFNKARQEIPEEWSRLNKKFHSSSETHKRKVIKACLNKLHLEWESWDLVDKYSLGSLLLELFAVSTGLVKLDAPYDPRRRRAKSMMRATDETLKWLAESHDYFKEKYPFYLPLVTPPEDWVSPNEGGYPANILMRWPLVHQYNRKARKLTYKEMPEVYDAVNSLQRVAWRINDFVFAVFDGYWRDGKRVADIPGGSLTELPPKPEDIASNPQSRRDWKRRAKIVYDENVELGAKKILYGKIHFVARHYQYQDFWFPYKLDFRGRAYPIPAFLNPQGCSLAKGLLRFSEGKRVATDEAIGWFFVHGANTFGLDKVTFEERIAWVQQHDSMILDIAADPLNYREWEEADSPWQFLAWCEEYARWKEDPDNFLSYLPVSMDGTNNGLQIFSLLLRDPIGAKATNVSPSDKPFDIYQEVADSVTEILQDEKDGSEYAANWINFCKGKLPRSATKRPVMVLPYSGTAYTIREYVEEWLEDEIAKRGLKYNRPFSTNWKHTQYLTKHILEVIKGKLVGAVQAMAWLRSISDICTARNQPLIWTTPSGFECYLSNFNTKPLEIKTRLGKLFRLRRVRIDTLKLSKRGQANGIVPDYIHSLDASILVKVINEAVKNKITNLAVAHDCYGTHAADCPKLAEIIREVIVEMFGSRNLLDDFRNQIQALVPDELPPVPEMGTLDVESVRESRYIFG